MVLQFIVSVILKGITGWIRFRLMLVRRFQEFMSEIGMGLFIAYGAEDTTTINNLCDYLEALIKAYVIVISPACIFSSFMDEILEEPKLMWFFENYPGFYEWKDYLIKHNFAPPFWETRNIWAEKYPGAYALPPPTIQPGEIASTPSKLQEWLYGELSKKIDVEKWTPHEIVSWINANLVTKAPDPKYTYAPLSFWYLVHPTIWMDWTVIKTYVIMLYTYRLLAATPRKGSFVQPYVTKQRVHIYANEILAAVQHLKADGTLTLEIPDIPEMETITLNTYGLCATVQLRAPFAPVQGIPQEVIIINSDDFTKLKQIVQDDDTILINPNIQNVTPEEISEITGKYKLKLLLMMDTQPYNQQECPAFYNIFYVKKAPLCQLCDSNMITIEEMKQHFGSTAVPALWDYFTLRTDKIQEANPWAVSTQNEAATWSYAPLNKSWIIEAPYDGFWYNVNIVDKWLRWIYGYRVIVMSQTTTDHPTWHQYPTLDETMKKWAEANNVKFSDLRT